jgi:uncharacterized membrane protein YGL010W
MKSLSEQIASYASYHRDARNKLTHFFGVPLVTFSFFLCLGWIRLSDSVIPVTAATIFCAIVFVYYLVLDWRIALCQAPVSLVLLLLADWAARLPFKESLVIFALAFVAGWLIQLLGHTFEGRRPALFDNLLQVFNAPLFLTAEVMEHLGFQKMEQGQRSKDAGLAPKTGSSSPMQATITEAETNEFSH